MVFRAGAMTMDGRIRAGFTVIVGPAWGKEPGRAQEAGFSPSASSIARSIPRALATVSLYSSSGTLS